MLKQDNKSTVSQSKLSSFDEVASKIPGIIIIVMQEFVKTASNAFHCFLYKLINELSFTLHYIKNSSTSLASLPVFYWA